MRLSTLFPKLSATEREDLARKAEIDPGYLWQLATRWRGKKPSLDVINRLVRADKRLTLTDMVKEFSEGSPEPKAEQGA